MSDKVNGPGSFRAQWETIKSELIKNGNATPTTADIVNEMVKRMKSQNQNPDAPIPGFHFELTPKYGTNIGCIGEKPELIPKYGTNCGGGEYRPVYGVNTQPTEKPELVMKYGANTGCEGNPELTPKYGANCGGGEYRPVYGVNTQPTEKPELVMKYGANIGCGDDAEYQPVYGVITPKYGANEGCTKPEPGKVYDYTVQLGESFTGIIKRMLQAQGTAEPTAEDIKAAKEAFKQLNPNAVKTSKKGIEYLLAGAKVKLSGELEDKNNAEEQSKAWVQRAKDTLIGKKAEDMGLRPTYGKGIYYDEDAKIHYKWNSKKKDFEKMDDVSFVAKDGSYIKTTKTNEGAMKRVSYDKNGNIKSMELRKSETVIYKNRDYVMERVGLRPTYNSEIFYDENSKLHFKWNPEARAFEAMDKNIAHVGRDGKFYDKNKKEIKQK